MGEFKENGHERPVQDSRTPTQRVYVHSSCGGETCITGLDFIHICDPFWLCTSTYCSTCGGFVPLSDVYWADTGESISRYRKRLRAQTPGSLKAWRYGLGFVTGGAFGAAVGLLVWIIDQPPQTRSDSYMLIGGLLGGVVCYFLGTLLLNRAFGISYRRMR